MSNEVQSHRSTVAGLKDEEMGAVEFFGQGILDESAWVMPRTLVRGLSRLANRSLAAPALAKITSAM